MSDVMKFCVAIVLVLVSQVAQCGIAVEALMKGTPQFLDMGERGPSCGFYMKGIRKDFSGADTIEVFDLSVLVSGVAGIVKSGVVRATSKDIAAGQTSGEKIAPTKVWVRALGSGERAEPTGRYLETETEGTVMYFSNVGPTLALVDAVLSGKQIQLGLTLPGDSVETIYFGSVVLSEAEQHQILECLDRLIKFGEGLREKSPTS